MRKQVDKETDAQLINDATMLFLKLNQDSHTKEHLEYALNKMQQLQYFNQFIETSLKTPEKTYLLDLCSRLRVEYFKGGEVVFKENDPSNDKLYIIFYGSVLLLRQKSMETLQTQPQPEPEKTTFKLTQILNAKKFTHKLMQQPKEATISLLEKQNLQLEHGNVIRILKRGEGFGDKALTNNVPRSLTVAAYSPELFLVVLKKDDFMQFNQSYQHEKRQKQQLMFSVFKNVKNEYSTTRLESMIYSCQTIKFDRGDCLTQQDESGEHLYIVQEGDITLYQKDGDLQIPLCIVSTGHLLGEEIVISKRGCYEYTAVASTQIVKVLLIQSHQFYTTFPEECRKQIIQEYKSKFSNRKELFSNLNRQCIVQSQKTVRRDRDQYYSQPDLQKFHRLSIQSDNKSYFIKKQKRFELDTFASINNFVETELKLSRVLNPIKCVEKDAFDFGNTPPDQVKRMKFLFESKFSTKKPPQNFLQPKTNVLQLSIKQNLVKTIRRTRRANFFGSCVVQTKHCYTSN